MRLVEPQQKQIEQLKTKNKLLNTLENEGTQIVVVGDTSTGKSTTINFLLGFPINFEAGGIGTRRPCVLCQEYDEKADVVRFKVNFLKFKEDSREVNCTKVAKVASLVKQANDASNEDYFDCCTEFKKSNPGKHMNPDYMFDDEPIYVTMYHKSFVYGLRLIDLPGLTADCDAPLEIAKKYIQPGNVACLVIGRDNAANAQFPKLAAKMASCSKVIFMQNFATAVLSSLNANLEKIKEKITQGGGAAVAASIQLFCTEYGYPKTEEFVKNQLWKPDVGQEDWVDMSADRDIGEVRDAMWAHAEKLAVKLKNENPGLITGPIKSGIEEPLNELISYQLQNLDAEIQKLKDRVTAKLESKTKLVNELEEEVKTLNDPPHWNNLLLKVAQTVSEFLDTTVEVRAENYKQTGRSYNKDPLTTFEGASSLDERGFPGEASHWTGCEETDKEILDALEEHAHFEAKESLLCLRSWLRLLDEFTGMLAFCPMNMIREESRKEVLDNFEVGAVGYADKSIGMLKLVCDANGEGGEGMQAIRSELATFQKRLSALVNRDIGYAMKVFGEDESGEITEFLRLVGVEEEDMKEEGAKLVKIIRELILKEAEAIIDKSINGIKIVDGQKQTMQVDGLATRTDEEQHNPHGLLKWLLPFKSHYFNGQIPWRDLAWCETPTGGIEPPPNANPSTSNAPAPSPGVANPSTSTAPASSPGVAIAPGLLGEIPTRASPKGAGNMNFINAMNLRMYSLCTNMYDVELTPSHSNLTDYELEAMKLLKAMQAEVASFWASIKLSMLQNLADLEKIKTFILGAYEKRMQAAGKLDYKDESERIAKVLGFIANKRAVDLTGFDGYFYSTGFKDEYKQTTEVELRSLETQMQRSPQLFDGRRAPWNGGLERTKYLDLLSRTAAATSNTKVFPATYKHNEACRRSWMRVTEEFLFLVMQLSMRGVTSRELSLAKASTGASLVASPQEIVGKLVLHRLRELGREAGLNMKDRLMHVYDRDVGNALKQYKEAVDKEFESVEPKTIEGTPIEEWIRLEMAKYAGRVIDRDLKRIQDSFDQLVPFDWSTLNGRLPLGSGLQGFREKTWTWNNETQSLEARVAGNQELADKWTCRVQDMWTTPVGDSILKGKMYVGFEPGMTSDDHKVTCHQSVQGESYNNLVLDQFKRICDSLSSPEFDTSPAGWNSELAPPRFQETALMIWKAIHISAIDYCRPRLKKMLADIYQRDKIRAMLTHRGELDFRELYHDKIEGKREALKTEKAKHERLKNALAALSGGAVSVDDAMPLSAQVDTLKQELDDHMKKAGAKEEAMAQKISEAEKMEKLLNQKLTQAGPLAAMGKKYRALDRLSAHWKFSIDRIKLAQMRLPAKSQVWFAAYWFKNEGWWGEDVKGLTPPPKKDILPYQNFIETRLMDPTGGGFGSVEIRESDLDQNLVSGEHPLVTFRIPPLFPYHEHVVALECWQTEKSWNNTRQTLLFTALIPLAYVLKPPRGGDTPVPPAKSMTELWAEVGKFKFSDDPGFDLQEDSSGSSFTFTGARGLRMTPAAQGVASDAQLTVALKRQLDVEDLPLNLLSDADMAAATASVPAGSAGGAPQASSPTSPQVGMPVEYHSASQQKWIPCKIKNINAQGDIEVDCKPGVFITVSQQRSLIKFNPPPRA